MLFLCDVLAQPPGGTDHHAGGAGEQGGSHRFPRRVQSAIGDHDGKPLFLPPPQPQQPLYILLQMVFSFNETALI